jgi:hypothetical protein
MGGWVPLVMFLGGIGIGRGSTHGVIGVFGRQ